MASMCPSLACDGAGRLIAPQTETGFSSHAGKSLIARKFATPVDPARRLTRVIVTVSTAAKRLRRLIS
jgi:hypothetical protein